MALAIMLASVLRSWPITAAWTTQRALRSWPVVTTAAPTSMGPWSIASVSTASPPTRLMAPATPDPIQSSLLAALAIASTSSSVMSPDAISSLVLHTDVFMTLQDVW